MKVAITLPWPPSVNHYWAPRKGGGTRINDKAREYRTNVKVRVLTTTNRQKLLGRLKVVLIAHPPDRRKRDLDNLFKGVLDGLQHAGVYEDDNQIDDLRIMRMPVKKGGMMQVMIEEIE